MDKYIKGAGPMDKYIKDTWFNEFKSRELVQQTKYIKEAGNQIKKKYIQDTSSIKDDVGNPNVILILEPELKRKCEVMNQYFRKSEGQEQIETCWKYLISKQKLCNKQQIIYFMISIVCSCSSFQPVSSSCYSYQLACISTSSWLVHSSSCSS